MEVSGVVLRRVPCISGAGTNTQSSSKPSVSGGSVAVVHGTRFSGVTRGVRVSANPRKFSGFCDNGHLQYYNVSQPRCGGDKDKQKGSAVLTTKKKLKLLKGFSKGLSMFSELGLTLDPQNRNLVDEVQGKLSSDAAEVLFKQLQQLRAEEKELKRKRKQEKAKLKASKMKTLATCESSSESSDSECGQVVNMNCLRKESTAQTTVNELRPLSEEATSLALPISLTQGANKTVENVVENRSTGVEFCSRNNTSFSNSSVSGLNDESSLVTSASPKRIEVCMGNKCKKSGAGALLEQFERVMGVEGAVVGCKCMGKCRNGPNVRVQNSVNGSIAERMDDSVKFPSNPLCIGVGMEDVDVIVANFFGENKNDVGLTVAA
ncbi:Diacylglycerol acyltransferase [Quillaja saponaria]|uniref:Diacylglycerol acyltransferase n=1 Tax=Quillaja saponaria TaxID=32244 RepID=A0AAD7LC07_QUISA|nr:Diacylglycerol acyltransferase [Quillaja saponaria]